MDSKTATDEILVEHFLKTRDYGLFSILYTRYYDKVYRKCLSLLSESANAQDATQDVFIKVFLNLDKFTGRSRFGTWLYAITNNYCIDLLRRKRLHLENVSGNIIDYDRPDSEDEMLFREVRLDQLRSVMQEIREGDRSILKMKYLKGLSIREISRQLDKSESAVKMQIRRAKNRFRAKHKRLFASAEVA